MLAMAFSPYNVENEEGFSSKHSKTCLGSETNKQIEQNNNNKKSRRYLKFSLILQTLTYSCFHYLAMLVVGVGVSVCLVCVLGVGGGGGVLQSV